MSRILLFALLLFVCPALAQTRTSAASKSSSAKRDRELRRRALVLTDENAKVVHEILVAFGVPTTLAFEQPLKGGVVLADLDGAYAPPQQNETTVLVVPVKELNPSSLTTLTVTLSDGTIIPFRLVPGKQVIDVQVDVSVTSGQLNSTESSSALKSSLEQVRAQLDECNASSGNAGISKVASLILAQDFEKPAAFTVERHSTRHLDKQSRLLVELRASYRLFSQTYVVLTVENRDPAKHWVLERPEIAIAGGGEMADAKVVAFQTEMTSLPPEETEKIILVFNTPPQSVGQRFVLSLFEKAGNRHVRLEDVRL